MLLDSPYFPIPGMISKEEFRGVNNYLIKRRGIFLSQLFGALHILLISKDESRTRNCQYQRKEHIKYKMSLIVPFWWENGVVLRIACTESWNMPDGICLWFHSLWACQIFSKLFVVFSYFLFFIIVHVWFPSPQQHFLFAECPLSQILETSKEE